MPLTIAIIGAGPLGRWLAMGAAQSGYRVLLEDVMPANLLHAQEALRQQLGPQALNPAADPPAPASQPGPQIAPRQTDPEALSRIEFVSTIEENHAALRRSHSPDELH